jgi:hypothetical protein
MPVASGASIEGRTEEEKRKFVSSAFSAERNAARILNALHKRNRFNFVSDHDGTDQLPAG